MNSPMTKTALAGRASNLALGLKIVALLLFVAAATTLSVGGPATFADNSGPLHDALRAALR